MLIFLKFIMLVGILFLSISIGNLKAKTYENRVKELKKIKNGLEILKSKIEFTYEPIRDSFYEISKIVYSNEKNIFNNTIENMEKLSVLDAWNVSVENDNFLIEEDKETIKMFGKLLGKTDKLGQINEINITSKLIDNLIDKAEEEKNKNFKLFKTLGTVVGIGICIILV